MWLALCFLLITEVNAANTRIIKPSEITSFHGEANRHKRANLSSSNGNGTKTENIELQMQNASNKGTVLGQRIMAPESQHTQQVKPVNYKPQTENASKDATFLNKRVQAMLKNGAYGMRPPEGLPETPEKMRFIDNTAYTILFDMEKRRPLYSAYSLEAQNINKLHSFTWKTVVDYDTAAFNHWYGQLAKEDPPLHRGHLNPAHLNSYDIDRYTETYRYENAVPQYSKFNKGRWKAGENGLLKFVRTRCWDGTVYFVTGVSDNYVDNNKPPKFPKANSAEIQIPNSMWTAACCVHSNDLAESVAVMGNNVPTDEVQMTQLDLDELQKRLGTGIHLFPHDNNACEKSSNFNLEL